MSLLDLGAPAPVGAVPRLMNAQVVRPDRYGEPGAAYQREIVPVPTPGPRQVLVYVMAAGINYNGIWAAAGKPVDLIALRTRRGDACGYHVGGSDGSGIVCALGADVGPAWLGREVVVTGPVWAAGSQATTGVLGYEVNHGTFGQLTLAGVDQCLPKPGNLGWHEAASLCASACSSHRMLFGFAPHTVKPGDVVLVWGGSGGLGAMAIQLVRLAGGRPVAVTSSPARAAFCRELGAVGTIDRTAFDHWGAMVPDQDGWLDGARAFGEAIYDAVGERVRPRIVVEHPGNFTIPTSLYVCAPEGMVVTCAATTGALASFDLRHLWMREKRIQGSHSFGIDDARAVLRLAGEGRLLPCNGRRYSFDEIGQAHEDLLDGGVVGKATAQLGS